MATAQIIDQQFPASAPNIVGTDEATNALLLPVRAADRLAHFPSNVYNLTSTSHLMRLLKVLLGDAGIGGVRKNYTFARLQQTLSGSHFIDLDRFYGALFSVRRRVAEDMLVDPNGVSTPDEWTDQAGRDASYRSRIEQFGRAISFGATPTGMELAAEALLNVDCDIYESWVIADRTFRTWGDIETAVTTYGGAEAYTYGELEDAGLADANPDNRYTFTVRPKRQITLEERYDVERVLRQLKPASTRLLVDADGIALHREMHLRGITADSEYWEVRSAVIPNDNVSQFYSAPSPDGNPVEQPRPPFSQYQGESWTYNGDIQGVVGYSEKDGVTVPGSDRTRSYFVKSFTPFAWGYVDFLPPDAIQDLQNTEAGRVISDAILVSHPYARPRTQQSSISVEGQMLPTILGIQNSVYADTLRLWSGWLNYRSQGWFNPTDSNTKMWATAERLSSDPTREITELRYATPRVINNISAEVSRFPHVLDVEVRDMESGEWTRVYEGVTRDSVPQQIEAGIVALSPAHPQHLLATHWISVRQRISPVETDRVRFVMTRQGGSVPVDARGNQTPYSLAIRKIDVGFRVTSQDDLPRGDLPGTVFAQARDLLGSSKFFTTHHETGAGLLAGQQWQSEPQPVPYAVVNLYVDARDDGGVGQVMERFYLDPLYTGPHLSIYWSNDTPSGSFEASDDPIPLGVVAATGTVTPTSSGLVFSDGSPSYLDIPNSAIHFDPAQPWMVAVGFLPHWPSTTDQEHTIFSMGASRLFVVDNLLTFATETGGRISLPLETPSDQRIRVVVAYEPGRISMVVLPESDIADTIEQDTTGFPFSTPFTTLRLGARTTSDDSFVDCSDASSTGTGTTDGGDSDETLDDTLDCGGATDEIDVGNLVLTSFILKTGVAPSMDDLTTIAYSMPNYVLKPRFVADDEHTTDNAILRYHPIQQNDQNPYGLLGGPGDRFASLAWKPIARDFVLQKGFVQIPPTKAQFWKFEFTNLVAQPYESFVPITRTIKTFPLGAIAESAINPVASPLRPGMPTTELILGQGGRYTFADTVVAATLVSTTDVAATGQRTATSAIYVQNYEVAQRLAAQSHLFNFLPVGKGTLAPRFVTEGPHVYETTAIAHSTKVGFFVGLKDLRAYRLEYAADDDTMQYRDIFHDDFNIEKPYEWNLDPNRLFTTDSGLPAVATSIVFESRHPIRALQYATQQNDPPQIVPDDEFRDATLINYDWTDDSMWHAMGDAAMTYNPDNTTVRISRAGVELVEQSAVGNQDLGIEQPPPHPPFALRTPLGDDGDAHQFGGLESPLVTISAEGRIHAAVRFQALVDLSSPLVLQIVNAAGAVLASKSISAKKGQTVEETLSYTINSYLANYQPLPTEFSPPRTIIDRPVQPVFEDPALTYVSGPSTPDTSADDQVRVRIVQYGPSVDVWLMDALSLFDDSIVWEFSVDGGVTWWHSYGIRNFVNGILTFPEEGTQLRWRVTGYRPNMNVTSIQIRPWYQDRLVVRSLGQFRGPNVSMFDHEPPIQSDPEFGTWNQPVPRTWFLAGKPFPLLPRDPSAPQNEFSSSFGRNAIETLDAITDVATRQQRSSRYGYQVYDSGVVPHEVPGEQLPDIADAATRSGGIFARAAAESLAEPVDAAYALLIPFETDPINRRPVGKPTG